MQEIYRRILLRNVEKRSVKIKRMHPDPVTLQNGDKLILLFPLLPYEAVQTIRSAPVADPDVKGAVALRCVKTPYGSAEPYHEREAFYITFAFALYFAKANISRAA